MNKKGFTLIELLAVIVLLAIIALIAVPIVLNIIEKAREGAAIASARSYIKAVETYVVSSELDKTKIKLEKSKKYNVTITTKVNDKLYQSINDLIEIKGSLPVGSENYIKIDENNRIKEALLTINGYVILIRYDEVISIAKGNIINVESITLDKEEASIEIEKTLQLTATITPNNATNKDIAWTTSNNKVATVNSDGLVTSIGVGNAIITATASNGKKATANITVKDKCEEEWCTWLKKANIDYINYNNLDEIVNNESLMNTLTSNEDATDYMASSNNIMNKVVNSSIARKALYTNNEITASKLASSSIAINAMKNSSQYKNKTLSCKWNYPSIYPCRSSFEIEAFIFEFKVSQYGDSRNTSGWVTAKTGSSISNNSCNGGQTCKPMNFTTGFYIWGDYYLSSSGTSTTTFYYFEI